MGLTRRGKVAAALAAAALLVLVNRSLPSETELDQLPNARLCTATQHEAPCVPNGDNEATVPAECYTGEGVGQADCLFADLP